MNATVSGMVDVFDGQIAAIGTTSGTRLVIGTWRHDRLGHFSDVMCERPDGHRILLAPNEAVAQFVASTYTFDEIRVEPVTVSTGTQWRVHTPSLDLAFEVGRRRAVSLPLSMVPARLRHSETFARLCDPIARVLMPGVRTHGSAGGNRTEWYAARGVRLIRSAEAVLDGSSLGDLARVDPPVSFGFGSAPRTASVTRLRTMVRQD